MTDAPHSVKIAPSLLSADFSALASEIEKIENAGADYLHLDVMDGHFVPNLTFGPPVIEAIRSKSALPFDVHLMITEPEHLIDEFIAAGSDIVTVHAETGYHVHRTLQHIRKQGCKAGLALNPGTPLSAAEELIEELDLLLIMTVNPGFGGQSYIDSMSSKIRRARRLLDDRGSHAELEVDGGIKIETAAAMAELGATVMVSGSGIFGKPDPAEAVKAMRTELEGVKS